MFGPDATTHAALRRPAPKSRPSAPQRRGDRWRIQWTDHAGQRFSRSFASYDEAVRELERVKGLSRFTSDGCLPAAPEPMRFREFVETFYIPNRTNQKRNPKDDLSILTCHLYPVFGSAFLTEIRHRDIEAFKAAKSVRGPHENRRGLVGGSCEVGAKTLGNILTLLKSILRYAEDLDFLHKAPKVRLPKVTEQAYNYLRTDGEVQAFLKTALEEEDGVFELFATAIYTGMRAGELFGLTWADVDFDNRLIRVARSFDKSTTKSGKVRHVPILDVLYPILRDWRLRNANNLVFPNDAGKMHTPNPRVTKIVFKRCLKRADVADMRFHDLRHTFASHWAMKGGSREKLQEILGHQSPIMTQRYRHLEPHIYAQDRAIFGLSPRVLRGEEENVVALPLASEAAG